MVAKWLQPSDGCAFLNSDVPQLKNPKAVHLRARELLPSTSRPNTTRPNVEGIWAHT
jgi:hypothetical protein